MHIAATRFRENGLNGIGVADLMRDAGLTHGGFYRHFASRDELVVEAVERALQEGARALDAVAGISKTPLAAVVDAYLSPAHCNHLGTSCAVTTLASDLARGNDRARAAYTRQVDKYLELLTKLIPGVGPRSKRKRATKVWPRPSRNVRNPSSPETQPRSSPGLKSICSGVGAD